MPHIKVFEEQSGEMGLRIKHLPQKHEDHSSDPRTCDASTREKETGVLGQNGW